jgi:hypothetical protein
MAGIDRRIQKTKKILSEALIALILEKGYEKVTIQDIIDKANVGRSTFYSHYESKDQLLLAGPQNLGVRIFGDDEPRLAGAGKDQALDFLPLFRHAAENLALSKAMIGRKSGEIFTGHLQSHLAGEIRERFQGRFGKSRQDKLWLRYFSTAAAGTVMGFLISWLEDDLSLPAEEVARICGKAVGGLFGAATAVR